MLISISIFYFFVLFLILSVKYNIKYHTTKYLLKNYAFVIVTYAYYLNISPNTILKIISKHQLLSIYTSYSIL